MIEKLRLTGNASLEGPQGLRLEAASMATTAPLNWGRIVLRGIVAGIAGGVILDLFIYFTGVLPHHGSMLTVWQNVALTAFGKVALTSASYAWAGLALHFAVSIGWAIGFAYLAEKQPGVNAQPVLSGVIFGFVVYLVMQMVLYTAQALVITGAMQVVSGIIAHTVFFGLPVALVTRAQTRSSVQP